MEEKNLNSRIDKHLESYSLPDGISKEDAWKSIQHSTKFDRRRKSIIFTPWMRYAASMALLCVISILIYGLTKKVQVNSLGENVVHKLPDGSIVTLNAHTTIEYNDAIWFFQREIGLSGHAYFDVEKGETFKVNTESGSVEVLGTEFIVNQNENIFEVSCFEGTVKVEDGQNAQAIILSKGLATAMKGNKLVSPYNFNHERYVAWKKGLFFFENQPLSAVFIELERFYGVKIETTSVIVNDASFSGVFNRRELKNSLEIICSSMGLSYEIMNSQEVKIF